MAMESRAVKNILGELVSRPANGRTGHGRQDAGADTLEEALETLASKQQLAAGDEAVDIAQLSIRGSASGLEHGFDDVHGGGKSSGKTTSNSTSSAVGERIVLLGRVHRCRYGLIGEELEGRKGDSHRESGGVRDVESSNALLAVNVTGAIHYGPVHLARVVHLHALLDDIKGIHQSVTGDGSTRATSSCRTVRYWCGLP